MKFFVMFDSWKILRKKNKNKENGFPYLVSLYKIRMKIKYYQNQLKIYIFLNYLIIIQRTKINEMSLKKYIKIIY